MKPIATDTSEFRSLIEGGYVYVDKTALLHRLVSGVDGTQFFISRPRRFGKSLMLSTLRHVFEGRRELFRGLAISRTKYDWKPYPVVHLDMSDYDMEPGVKAFDKALRNGLLDKLAAAKIPCRKGDAAPALFARLIQGLSEKSPEGKVVLLIDEYDHPPFPDDGRRLEVHEDVGVLRIEQPDRSFDERRLRIAFRLYARRTA